MQDTLIQINRAKESDTLRKPLKVLTFLPLPLCSCLGLLGTDIIFNLGVSLSCFSMPLNGAIHTIKIYNIHYLNLLAFDLQVKFVGEEGVDEGGVQKEFFQLLVRWLSRHG